MRIGFAKNDITPRVGVELCGFGPFRCRHSIAVRDRLWARAMVVEQADARAAVISCDLIGLPLAVTERVREIISRHTDLPHDAIMVHCTHTHSGPATATYCGWGTPDPPYLETLPQRIAAACIEAADRSEEATLHHAEAPCEGIGLNREYDRDAPPLEEVLDEGWRPARPERTDTTCHVLRAQAGGRTIGFLSYFGCHPVVCCAASRYIHGDYCGVATNLLEREHPGAVGLFLQGAQGDVNSCVVHKPEQESLLALDIISGRYARAVREGLRRADPIEVETVRTVRRRVVFSRKRWDAEKIRAMLADQEAVVHAPQATDEPREVRMAVVYLIALRRLLARTEAGDRDALEPPIELQGLRLGPVALLGSPFETFQAIKNDVRAKARAPVPLVMGLTNDSEGYAPDRTAAERGGYAADTVPMIRGTLPFADIHEELVAALLDLDAALFA